MKVMSMSAIGCVSILPKRVLADFPRDAWKPAIRYFNSIGEECSACQWQTGDENFLKIFLTREKHPPILRPLAMKPIVLPVQFVFIQQIAGSEGVIQPIEEADSPRAQASAARSKNEKTDNHL